MNDAAPYRARCAQYASCVLGPAFQHGRSAPLIFQPTAVTVKCPNGDVVTGALGSNAHTDSCDGVACSGTAYDGTNYNTGPCGPWNVAPAVNTYTVDSMAGPVNLYTCNKAGYKQVYARRVLHGFPGLADYERRNQGDNRCLTNGSTEFTDPDWFPAYSFYRGYAAGSLQYKYTSMAVSASMDCTVTTPDGSVAKFQMSEAWSAAVSQYGIQSVTGATGAGLRVTHNVGPPPTVDYGDLATNNAVQINSASFATALDTFLAFNAGSIAADLNPTNFYFFDWKSSALTTGVLTINDWECYDNGTTARVKIDATITATIVYTPTEYPPSGGTTTYVYKYVFSMDYSSPNTVSAITADCDSLLETWDLNDDLLYPFTTGAYNQSQPYIVRNEVPGPVSPNYIAPAWTWTDTGSGTFSATGSFTDDNAGLYDGSVIGAPNTAGGMVPEDYFDPFYVDWKTCPPAGGYYIQEFGGYRSVGTNLPPRTTHWPNIQEILAINPTIGQWSLSSGDTLYKSKWAETVVRLPSYNHARPAGVDRNLMDETAIGCVLSFDGTTATFGNHITVAHGDTVAAYGTANDGIYTVNAGGTSTAVITVTYVKPLPAGFSYWDTSGIIGRLRFPSCAPMFGRLAVVSVADNMDGTCTIVTDAAPVPLDWAVNLCGIGMTLLAGNKTPTASDPSTFIITATYADIAAAKWVVLYGALPSDPTVTGVAHWYWGDTAGKGNWTLMGWQLDNRTNGEHTRLSGMFECDGVTPVPAPSTNNGYASASFSDQCKGFIACDAWRIVCSPNASDTPANGVRFDAGTVPIDYSYGCQNWLVPSQAMTDPLWQTPHTGCGTAPDCVPFVEARAILPYASASTATPDNGAGAGQNESPPTPPVDYTMLSPVTYTTGNVEYPPGASANPVQHYVPSGIFGGC